MCLVNLLDVMRIAYFDADAVILLKIQKSLFLCVLIAAKMAQEGEKINILGGLTFRKE